MTGCAFPSASSRDSKRDGAGEPTGPDTFIAHLAMNRTATYSVITTVRNEERNLPLTIESVVNQTIRPASWIIVDDGSKDRTGTVADAAAVEHRWVQAVHRRDRGFRQPGTGVVEAFYDGLGCIGDGKWDFLAKLDGDLSFAPDYFERCLEHFEQDSRLGIAGGLICRRQTGILVAESPGDPAFHVRGAVKIYRRACWEQIGGLIKAPGWDTVDECKANLLGWNTRTFHELKIHQLKDTGAADGHWRNWVKNGLANYITGYHPLFMALKCLKRSGQKPYLVGAAGLWWGFCRGYVKRVSRVEDPALIRYVRRQQLNKLLGKPSLW